MKPFLSIKFFDNKKLRNKKEFLLQNELVLLDKKFLTKKVKSSLSTVHRNQKLSEAAEISRITGRPPLLNFRSVIRKVFDIFWRKTLMILRNFSAGQLSSVDFELFAVCLSPSINCTLGKYSLQWFTFLFFPEIARVTQSSCCSFISLLDKTYLQYHHGKVNAT